MKTIIQIVLWIACIGLGYLIYISVTGPIEFNKVKVERFAKVVSNLKDIRNSQEAYKTVNGKYAKDFNSLITFVDTGKYVITQQRDSSYMEFDKVYQIDLLKEVKIIDTLGFVSVKDSLFKADDRFKSMMNVPGASGGEKFEMKADIIEKSGYKAPVFEAKVEKNVILYDQPKDLLAKENSEIGVDEVNGSVITVGSLEEVSTSGNWPPIYDKKGEQ
jgi:type II secretory pathway pseudopilin PulG